MLGLTVSQGWFLVVLVVAFALLLTERLRNDLVALLIIVSLVVTGVLEPREALAGFGSEAAIVVAAIFVLSEGLRQTGLSQLLGTWIGRWAGRSISRALAVIMSSVALVSAFTHHLTTTAIMLPVTINLSRERNLPASKLLMPLSMAASLGTTITIIGAPAFLIASSLLQQAGRPGLSIFSIAPIGLALSVVGTLYMILIGQRLLPAHAPGEHDETAFRLDDYFTEMQLLAGSALIGQPPARLASDSRYDFTIVGVRSNGRRLGEGWEQRPLEKGDVLLARTTAEGLVEIRELPGVELEPIARYGTRQSEPGSESHDSLVQAIVAPGAELFGRTIGEVDFRRRYGAIVIGVWRKQGWINQQLSRIVLQEGDVLVLFGKPEALARVGRDANFLMLVPFSGESRSRHKAGLAGLIMLFTVIAAATGALSIEIAALAGAVAMVMTRCLTPRQAYRSVDSRIYVFIAGALPLGQAMQKTGTSELIAHWIQSSVGGWSPPLILALIFVIVALLTQFMSDAATTAVFAPVVIALAEGFGHAPEPYVVAVAMAAVAAFLTPIGHHGNLLVYGPGRYRFMDFVKVGTPLTILIGAIVIVLAPMVFPG